MRLSGAILVDRCVLTHLAPDQPLPVHKKSLAKESNWVKWSQYSTLKISNKHQRKVSVHFVFSPVCKYSVLVYPVGFDFFSLKNKSIKKKSEVSTSECQVFGGLQGNRLCKISRLNLQRWSSVSLLTVGLLFIFGHQSRVHLTTLKMHSVSQTSPNLKQRTSPEVVNNNGNKATSLVSIPFWYA